MTDPAKPTTEPGDPPSGPRHLSRWVIALPALALVVGIALGALVVGVATDNDDTPAPDDAPTASAAESGDSTAVIVPDACRQAAASVAAATDLLRAAVSDIRNFRAEKILDLLNQLEDLDTQAREQAALCTDIKVTTVPSPNESPDQPGPSPSTPSESRS